jgi:anti-sigma B factor antagonist
MHEGHKLHETHIPGRGVDPAGAFTVEPVDGPDGVVILALRGELDIAATEEMRQHVDAAAGRRGLVLDLAEATFIDSAVLKELLRANTEMARYETRVVLADVSPPVQRLLDLTRTAQLFSVAPDRASALAQLES